VVGLSPGQVTTCLTITETNFIQRDDPRPGTIKDQARLQKAGLAATRAPSGNSRCRNTASDTGRGDVNVPSELRPGQVHA
jgi:hypothetical protein